MRRRGGAALALLLAGAAPAAPRPAPHDAEDYAFATCLTQQPSAFLRDQGYGLAAIVVARGGGVPARWAGVAAAVKAELARHPMTTIHGDGPVGTEQPMPIAYCLEVTRVPEVAAAVARVR